MVVAVRLCWRSARRHRVCTFPDDRSTGRHPCRRPAPGASPGSPSAGTTTPSSGRRGLARGRPADARGRRQHGQRRDLLLGAAGAAPGRVRLRLAGPRARPAARRTASASTWPRPPRRRRPGSTATAPGGAARDPRGRTRSAFGSRAAICPSYAGLPRGRGGITTQLAERYGDHPALAMWHVHNEYGVPVSRLLLRRLRRALPRAGCGRTYGTVDALNDGLGHGVLGPALRRLRARSTRRGSPRPSVNPGQALDFKRFARRHHARELPRASATSCTASRPASR